jgi:PAS domain-containing protein
MKQSFPTRVGFLQALLNLPQSQLELLSKQTVFLTLDPPTTRPTLNDALDKHDVPWPLPSRRVLRQMLAGATLAEDTQHAEEPQQNELPLVSGARPGVRHMFLLMSKEGLFLAVSDSLCEITGYTRAELLGVPVSGLMRPREDLAQTEPENYEAFMQLMRGERDILENVRSHGRRKDGRPVAACSTIYWCPSKEAWLIDAVEIPTAVSQPAARHGLTDISADMTTKPDLKIISPAERIERLERAVLLLAKHVGGTGWDKPLQDVLDEIQDTLRQDGLW